MNKNKDRAKKVVLPIALSLAMVAGILPMNANATADATPTDSSSVGTTATPMDTEKNEGSLLPERVENTTDEEYDRLLVGSVLDAFVNKNPNAQAMYDELSDELKALVDASREIEGQEDLNNNGVVGDEINNGNEISTFSNESKKLHGTVKINRWKWVSSGIFGKWELIEEEPIFEKVDFNILGEGSYTFEAEDYANGLHVWKHSVWNHPFPFVWRLVDFFNDGEVSGVLGLLDWSDEINFYYYGDEKPVNPENETATVRFEFDETAPDNAEAPSEMIAEKDNGYKVILPSPKWKGYKFAGWKVKDSTDTKVYAAGEEVAVAEDTTFVGSWKKIAEKEHAHFYLWKEGSTVPEGTEPLSSNYFKHLGYADINMLDELTDSGTTDEELMDLVLEDIDASKVVDYSEYEPFRIVKDTVKFEDSKDCTDGKGHGGDYIWHVDMKTRKAADEARVTFYKDTDNDGDYDELVYYDVTKGEGLPEDKLAIKVDELWYNNSSQEGDLYDYETLVSMNFNDDADFYYAGKASEIIEDNLVNIYQIIENNSNLAYYLKTVDLTDVDYHLLVDENNLEMIYNLGNEVTYMMGHEHVKAKDKVEVVGDVTNVYIYFAPNDISGGNPDQSYKLNVNHVYPNGSTESDEKNLSETEAAELYAGTHNLEQYADTKDIYEVKGYDLNYQDNGTYELTFTYIKVNPVAVYQIFEITDREKPFVNQIVFNGGITKELNKTDYINLVENEDFSLVYNLKDISGDLVTEEVGYKHVAEKDYVEVKDEAGITNVYIHFVPNNSGSGENPGPVVGYDNLKVEHVYEYGQTLTDEFVAVSEDAIVEENWERYKKETDQYVATNYEMDSVANEVGGNDYTLTINYVMKKYDVVVYQDWYVDNKVSFTNRAYVKDDLRADNEELLGIMAAKEGDWSTVYGLSTNGTPVIEWAGVVHDENLDKIVVDEVNCKIEIRLGFVSEIKENTTTLRVNHVYPAGSAFDVYPEISDEVKAALDAGEYAGYAVPNGYIVSNYDFVKGEADENGNVTYTLTINYREQRVVNVNVSIDKDVAGTITSPSPTSFEINLDKEPSTVNVTWDLNYRYRTDSITINGTVVDLSSSDRAYEFDVTEYLNDGDTVEVVVNTYRTSSPVGPTDPDTGDEEEEIEEEETPETGGEGDETTGEEVIEEETTPEVGGEEEEILDEETPEVGNKDDVADTGVASTMPWMMASLVSLGAVVAELIRRKRR